MMGGQWIAGVLLGDLNLTLCKDTNINFLIHTVLEVMVLVLGHRLIMVDLQTTLVKLQVLQ